nr:MAG TPA: hypothetical protein [Caudoviricetes sp.]
MARFNRATLRSTKVTTSAHWAYAAVTAIQATVTVS